MYHHLYAKSLMLNSGQFLFFCYYWHCLSWTRWTGMRQHFWQRVLNYSGKACTSSHSCWPSLKSVFTHLPCFLSMGFSPRVPLIRTNGNQEMIVVWVKHCLAQILILSLTSCVTQATFSSSLGFHFLTWELQIIILIH